MAYIFNFLLIKISFGCLIIYSPKLLQLVHIPEQRIVDHPSGTRTCFCLSCHSKCVTWSVSLIVHLPLLPPFPFFHSLHSVLIRFNLLFNSGTLRSLFFFDPTVLSPPSFRYYTLPLRLILHRSPFSSQPHPPFVLLFFLSAE